MRARIKEKNKNFKGALKDYDDAINLNKNKTKKLFIKRALIKKEMGDHESAIQDLNLAINYYPKNSHLYQTRGLLKFDNHFFISAIEDFDIFIINNPEEAIGYLYRALAKKNLSFGSRIKGIQSKINHLKDSNKDLKKAVIKFPSKHLKTRIEKLIKENEEAIKVINENIY